MAFKSVRHREKMLELVAQGLVSQADFDRHERETPKHAPLPQRLPPKDKSRQPR